MTVGCGGEAVRAPRSVTVLVLTPCIGGHFFGELVAGLSGEVARAGGRVVLVQTLDGGMRVDEESQFSDFAVPVAWDEVDGVVSITTAARAGYLQRLREAGKPVVLASTRMQEFPAPVALPDNFGGAVAAVEHLLGHGHSRIGFVGNLAQPDIRDRYTAYLHTLERYGIPADSDLVFAASNNDFNGGAAAAREVLAAAARPTAIMVATDRNAIGLMDALSAAGLLVPRDIALVGFDNMQEAAFSSPPLSSVDQRFDEIGALAARLVLDQIAGHTVAVGPHTPPPSPLQLRGSCGCTTSALGSAIIAGPDPVHGEAVEQLPGWLGEELEAALRKEIWGVDQPDDALSAAVAETVSGVQRLVHGGAEVTASDIQRLTTSLNRLALRPNVLRRIAMLVASYVQRVALTPGSGGTGVIGSAAVWQLTTALWQIQAGAFLAESETARALLQEQYAVDARMLAAGHADLRRLDWLVDTHVAAGVLAMWEENSTSPRLRIAGSFDPTGLLPNLVNLSTTAEEFPPRELIAAARTADGSVCVVVPICTNDRDWGLLAVIGRPDTASALQTYRHWANQLCASFEAQELQAAITSAQEAEKKAMAAARDAALAATERQTAFAASAAHELRTPTAAVLGFVEEVLDNDALAEQDRKYLDIAYRNAARLSALIDDLLIVGEADIGSGRMNLTPTPVTPLVESVLTSFAVTAQHGGITLRSHFPAETTSVSRAAPLCAMADPIRVEQALTNLVGNAVKFTPAGGEVTVSVTATQEMIKIAVQDTGIGIDSGGLEHIFDRFYRTKQAVDGGIKGTGHGLSIAQQMIQAQGGQLTVTSVIGQGATFTMTLPAAQPH